MNKLIMALLILAALCGVCAARRPVSPPSPSEYYQKQFKLMDEMASKYDAGFAVTWQPCGESNGWYDRTTDTITLCTELYDDPAWGMFVAAHETAHAILWEKSNDLGEYAADELATIYLLQSKDDVTTVQGGAAFFIENASPKERGDTHPSDRYRAVWLLKMVDGYLNRDAQSKLLYQSTVLRYNMRFELDQIAPEEDDLDTILEKLLQGS